MLATWSSLPSPTSLQLFVGLLPAGIVPVHETVTVWSALDGTVTSLEAGDEACVPIAATRRARSRTAEPAAARRA